MRVVLSIDMEGVSTLTDAWAIFAYRPEYWQTGKAQVEADTVAAAQGLLDAGADEVVVLDNHGSGNPQNVSAACLPPGARLETWNVFDLPAQGVDAMLQVGYHARGGTDGFISHTYVPGLRLRADGEQISESHGRAWAAGVPLLGIVGNDTHAATLGSLAGTPYLVVQRSGGRVVAEPVFADPAEGHAAIRAFAAERLRALADTPPAAPPRDVLLEAGLPNAGDEEEAMAAAGWRRTEETAFAAELRSFADARALVGQAMASAFAPLAPHWVPVTSAAEAAALPPERRDVPDRVLGAWLRRSHPDWTTAAPEVDLGA